MNGPRTVETRLCELVHKDIGQCVKGSGRRLEADAHWTITIEAMVMTSTAEFTRPRAIATPPCQRMGSQCRALRATLRVGIARGRQASLDHEATWLLGHTQHITFGEPWIGNGDLYVEAMLHVPCRYLRDDGTTAACALYGYRGRPPRQPPRAEQPRRLGGQRFRIIDGTRMVTRSLPDAPAPDRSLPVLAAANPCADRALPDRRQPAGSRRAAAISRSRSCAPRPSVGWRLWCDPGARRISVKWSGPGTSPSRSR